MELRCVHCGEPAEFIFQGFSFCEQHFRESAERAYKEVSKSDLERVKDAWEWAQKMGKMIEDSERIEQEIGDIVEKTEKEGE